MNPYRYSEPPRGFALIPQRLSSRSRMTVRMVGALGLGGGGARGPAAGGGGSGGRFGTFQQVLGVFLGVFLGFLLATTLRTALVKSNLCFLRKSKMMMDESTDPQRVLKLDMSKTPHNSDKNLVFVGVMTAHKYLDTRAKAVFETWGKHVPGKIAFFSSEASETEADIPLIRLRGVDDSYPPQKKSFMMLKYMHDHLSGKFEFFMRTDDDVYVRPDRLEKFLRSLNSSKALFVGQMGKGTQEEFGQLALKDNENFCMGGPGVIMSRVTLARVGPHVRECLKNLRSTHEDVEVGRCVQKFAGIPCTWSYEMQNILHHNGSGMEAFAGPLKQREVHRAITLHPIKNHTHMYRLHSYIQGLEVQDREAEMVQLMREITRVCRLGDLPMPKVNQVSNGMFLDHLGAEVSLQKWNPQVEEEVREWDIISKVAFMLGDANPKHKLTSALREAIDDVIRDIMDIINRLSKERGRVIEFKDILYGYIRYHPTLAAEYILDLLLLYKKYRGKKMTVPVRRHAYIQVPFGPLYIREAPNHSYRKRQRGTLHTLVDGMVKKGFQDFSNLPYQLSGMNVLPNSRRKPKRITFILPLSGRFGTFRRFMDDFRRVCLERDENVQLLVVLFEPSQGHEDERDNTEALLTSTQFDFPNTAMSIIQANTTFARALALDLGARECEDDDLMFFIDVDMTFDAASLDRIRHFTILGKQVYYPIVFSEFDPSVSRPGSNLSSYDHTLIDDVVGYWRSFGFGIAALYKADLKLSGGLDTSILGWGREDVDLFDKVLKSNVRVMRAADPGLIHIFHLVECDPALEPSQYQMCLGTRFSTYASLSTVSRLVLNHPYVIARNGRHK
ncbi:chondroitin sulfate synthase [Oratosquilla oratoria]|uniref:chondroitin sulfate synthase n=1 Tax=Oratosquilla oratoria TaxID=337810 RepID=UPI003F777FD4